MKRTHCVAGHELTEDNIYFAPKTGTRNCLACKARRNAESYARVKEARRLKREQAVRESEGQV